MCPAATTGRTAAGARTAWIRSCRIPRASGSPTRCFSSSRRWSDDPAVVGSIRVSGALRDAGRVVRRVRMAHERRTVKAPMPTMSAVRAAGKTNAGMQREVNEDRFHCDPLRGLFLVIDGVGGQAAGGKAADVALARVRERLERETGTAV